MFVSIMALATGLIFGFLMQRAEVLRYDRQLGALLLEDMTIVKFMLSAVCTGMVGIQVLHQMGHDLLVCKIGGNRDQLDRRRHLWLGMGHAWILPRDRHRSPR